MNNSFLELFVQEAMTSSDVTTTAMMMVKRNKKTGRGRSTLWYWRVWLFGVGGATVACIGIICNLITISVLANFRSKSSAPFLLICLAVSDSIYLLSLLLQENLTQICKAGLIDKSYNLDVIPHMYSKMFALHFVMQTVSAYIVVVISLERYIVVCLPFKAKTICSMKSARIVIVGVVVLSVAFHTPTYLAYHSWWAWHNASQTFRFRFARTDFGSTFFYEDIFFKWSHMTVNFFFPFVVLLTSNYLTIRSLRRNASVTIGNSTRGASESRLTIMICCMTAIFFVCELEAAIAHVAVSGYNSYKEVPESLNRFLAVADLVMMVNAAINFAIYCVTGRKFRATFKDMVKSPHRRWRRWLRRQRDYPKDHNRIDQRTFKSSQGSKVHSSTAGTLSTEMFGSFQQVSLFKSPTDENKETPIGEG